MGNGHTQAESVGKQPLQCFDIGILAHGSLRRSRRLGFLFDVTNIQAEREDLVSKCFRITCGDQHSCVSGGDLTFGDQRLNAR